MVRRGVHRLVATHAPRLADDATPVKHGDKHDEEEDEEHGERDDEANHDPVRAALLCRDTGAENPTSASRNHVSNAQALGVWPGPSILESPSIYLS